MHSSGVMYCVETPLGPYVVFLHTRHDPACWPSVCASSSVPISLPDMSVLRLEPSAFTHKLPVSPDVHFAAGFDPFPLVPSNGISPVLT